MGLHCKAKHWTTYLHLTLQWGTNLFFQYLTYSELTSINWKQSPGPQWHFSHNTSFLRHTQHPKLAGCLHITRILLVQNLQTQSSWWNCVSDILSHKREKRIQRQFRDNSIPPCRFHFICQVPHMITIVIFIAGHSWIDIKYNNELLYDNYIETMVRR